MNSDQPLSPDDAFSVAANHPELKNLRVMMSPRQIVCSSEYGPIVTEILEIIGYKNALVTDPTEVSSLSGCQ